MTIFQYHPQILQAYPDLVCAVLLGEGVNNQPTPEVVQLDYRNAQAQVLARLGDTPLSELPSIHAWRRAFSKFGVNPTQYRSAAEALLRRLTKAGDIPSINLLVDLGNLISIRYALPIAVFDLASVSGLLTVQFADGDERFTPLGQAEVENPAPGEVIFADSQDLVTARRWCWRQSAESAAQLETSRVLISIEGHHADARADVESALHDLQRLMQQYAGGQWQSAILDATHPAF